MVSLNRLTGLVFRCLQGRKDILVSHYLDTDREKYHRILRDVVIPECMAEASHVPGYPERIKQIISYTTPAFHDVWNFTYTELIYRLVADKNRQTEENLNKAQLLRALADLNFSSGALLDDIIDNTEQRMGKVTWSSRCSGGRDAAMYDGILLSYLTFFILQQHFRNDPGYNKMMELIARGSRQLMIGQVMDILGRQNATPTIEDFHQISHQKAGQIVSVGTGLELIHAGITSEDLIERTMDIFSWFGVIFQVWDDFNDYFTSKWQMGKESSDVKNGVISWASITALNSFSTGQAKEFQNCYGSSDPAKIARVHRLYDEIDLPQKYIDYMRKAYERIHAMISKVPDPSISFACTHYLDWFIGKVPKDI